MRRLERHWGAHRVTPGGGAPEGDLFRFEARYRVVLPVELRAYLRQLNGMAPNQADEADLSFRPLKQILPLCDTPFGKDVPGGEHLFVFADECHAAYSFAVSLTHDPNHPAPVFVIYQQAPQQVAARFTEFVERYLASDPGVLFPRVVS